MYDNELKHITALLGILDVI